MNPPTAQSPSCGIEVIARNDPVVPGSGAGNFDFLQIGIKVDREKLYKKIDKRVDQMIDEGLIEEVKNLLKKGYKKDLTSMTGIGYRQIVESCTRGRL